MSFITKRDRLFNDYDVFDLPARNEGKLKAYGSCTDTRAWSHFNSDKTEHLMDVIKKNNEMCRPKYVPTDVIVSTLMGVKNAEISRLKRKIAEFEQLLVAYDQLDLNEDQKHEIANAHEAIRAANKDLDDLFLDLDLTGFTEGIDSEAFETGKSGGDVSERSKLDEDNKSRGDEWSTLGKALLKEESKANQMGESCTCEIGTYVTDPRLDEMRDTIIVKDAKLNAMKNTIAVMENDVCEPYCLYAHIYTALEKIFGILCQNSEYKRYLDLLSIGTNDETGGIDIKGKILYKLKILEKFCIALIAPCSKSKQRYTEQERVCYSAEISPHIESTYALTSSEMIKPTSLDNKRARLIADIMDNDELKSVISEKSLKRDEDQLDECFILDNYNIDTENLNRLKNLQSNYDELMICYENLKKERDDILNRCKNYDELETELQNLRHISKDYNMVWNEKEHFKQRSENLDTLKEQFLVLSEETLNLEGQLKAECEINTMKAEKVVELSNENINLEKRISNITISFEKEKNVLECKLKESECKIMCQEQQIKSMSMQIDRLLEQDNKHGYDAPDQIFLLNEITALKEKITNLNDIIYCNEEEKEQLQAQFEDKLEYINNLKMEIEEWKSNCEEANKRHEYQEKCILESKNAVDNLLDIIKTKSNETDKLLEENNVLRNGLKQVQNNFESVTAEKEEVYLLLRQSRQTSEELLKKVRNNDKLVEECNKKHSEYDNLIDNLEKVQSKYNMNLETLETEKQQALISLESVKRESEHLLQKVEDYDNLSMENKKMYKLLLDQTNDSNQLKIRLQSKIDENNELHKQLSGQNARESLLLNELNKLKADNGELKEKNNYLQGEKNNCIKKLDEITKYANSLKNKMSDHELISKSLQNLRTSQDNLHFEKKELEQELREKSLELNKTIQSLNVSRKESQELLKKNEEDLLIFNETYKKCLHEKQNIETELSKKNTELEFLRSSYDTLKSESNGLTRKIFQLEEDFDNLQKGYDKVITDNRELQNRIETCCNENDELNQSLQTKLDDNKKLQLQIKLLNKQHDKVQENLVSLESENLSAHSSLTSIRKESDDLKHKLNTYLNIEHDLNKLKNDYQNIKQLKEKLQNEYDDQSSELNLLKKVNQELNKDSKLLKSQNETLESELNNSRKELLSQSDLASGSLTKIFQEVKVMKKEKDAKQIQIRELLDQIDEYDNKICNLTHDVVARDNKISIMQNHINGLEDELRRVHDGFSALIETNEQIKDISMERIEKTLKNIDSDHCQATNDMKKEIEKLQTQNNELGQELLFIKYKTESEENEKNKLKNENDLYLHELRNLETKYLGDTALSPDYCSEDDIVNSFDRIKKCLDLSYTKNSSLEQTLLSVQNSSQLLQSMTDEAKKLVEKEKQKIIAEKEEVIREKTNMENQVQQLRNLLEEQIRNDKYNRTIIVELESELLNQKLIIENINKHNNDIITNLNYELCNLQKIHENAIKNNEELKNEIYNLNLKNTDNLNVIENINSKLKEKIKEIQKLRHDSEMTKNSNEQVNVETQTNMSSSIGISLQPESNCNDSSIDTEIYTIDENMLKIRPLRNYPNEIQVLTASSDPTYNYFHSNYLTYKLKQLNRGPINQLSAINDSNHNLDSKFTSQHDTDTNVINIVDTSSCQDTLNTLSDLIIENDTNIVSNLSQKNEDPLLFLYKDDSIVYETSDNILFDSSKNYSLIPNENEINDPVTTDSNINTITFQKKNNNKAKIDVLLSIADRNIISTTSGLDKITPSLDSCPKRDISTPLELNIADDNNELGVKKIYSSLHSKSAKIINKINLDTPKDFIERNIKSDNIFSEIEDNFNNVNFFDTNDSGRAFLKKPGKEEVSPSQKEQLHVTESLPLKICKSNNSNEINILDKTSQKSLKVNVNHRKEESFIFGDEHVDPTNIKPVKIKERSESRNLLKSISSQPYHTILNKRINVPSNKKPINLLDLKSDNVGNNYNSLKTNIGSHSCTELSNKYSVELDKYYNTRENKEYELENNILYDDTNEFKDADLFDMTVSNNTELFPMKFDLYTVKEIPNQSYNMETAYIDNSTMTKPDDLIMFYETKIKNLEDALYNISKENKLKMDVIKSQYDRHIKTVINEHDMGVRSIQDLHEETIGNILKKKDNEIDNLRSISIEARRTADKYDKENKILKGKLQEQHKFSDQDSCKASVRHVKKRKTKSQEIKRLSKTNVQEMIVQAKPETLGPCTCSIDVKLSDTIRNIFEQVDIRQRKSAENNYIKYIANKLTNNGIDILDPQELSFLHLKVCRTWKAKITKDDALKQKIISLENEVLNKQRNTQQNIANLNRMVDEERKRLKIVGDALCRGVRKTDAEGITEIKDISINQPLSFHIAPETKTTSCACTSGHCLNERRSEGDLTNPVSINMSATRPRKIKTDNFSNRAILVKLEPDNRKDKRTFHDDPPVKLRRGSDRISGKTHKK